MTSQNKRGRGRPIGTGKDDAPTLSKVADLIVANPALRPTTAIKRVLDRLDPSIIRRLQVKWRAGKEEYLAQARSRRAVTVAPARRASVSYSPRTARQLMAAQRAMQDALGGSHLASVQAALNDPGLRAMREVMSSPAMQEAMRRYQESPAMKAIEEFRSSPTMRAIEELHNSPTMRAMRELQDSPTMRAMRDLQTKLGGLY